MLREPENFNWHTWMLSLFGRANAVSGDEARAPEGIVGALRSERTDSITLYCIVPNRNLKGLPKHSNGHPRASEQNLLPQNIVGRTREASRPPGDPILEGPRIRPNQDFPARSPLDSTPQKGKEGGGFPTRPHTTAREPKPQRRKERGGFPINPTRAHTTKKGRGRLPRLFGGGGGGVAYTFGGKPGASPGPRDGQALANYAPDMGLSPDDARSNLPEILHV